MSERPLLIKKTLPPQQPARSSPTYLPLPLRPFTLTLPKALHKFGTHHVINFQL
ncbi:hypothetical protein PSE10B_49050 [Pseudomonas amygdali pv. eriobotryae]|nr:hypothetical protein PSE10B_49050 [Pseudomonas amygdali pv. eriobotryae]GFZ71556.1 hypothetical protein PSE10C_22980 [Pseudomonas amygdali pv. eriobotryae]